VANVDPASLTIVDAARQLRAGAFTSRELTDACLDRMARDNPRLNAFILITGEFARKQADDADRELKKGKDRDRGPLHGIPISIKDLIDIAGFPTTAASRVREGHVATTDAPLITNLRRAGAVIVGKTNLHEFAMGTTNEDSAFGPALHPLDETRSPGGSSGGSAVSVVAGMCLATVGSDTGGSIRIPSAACGLVGVKPAFGELSCEGVVPLGSTLDCVGPLAKTVADAMVMYAAMAGRAVEAAPALAAPRLATLKGYFVELLQQEVRAAFDAALARLRAQAKDGAIAAVEIPHARFVPSIYLPTVLAEGAEYHARTLDQMPDKYTTPVRLRFELGRHVLAEDYLRAQRARDTLRTEINAALDTHDALLLPTMPIVAPPLGAKVVPMDNGRDEPVRAAMLRLTQPFNLTGHPAISIPLPVGTGLPVGLQIVARNTSTAAAIAGWCESHLAG
jgi:aspartyl-tRNA(Asn)/glutamyl-tRNA(Gln) amidotransferase subunit A